MKQNRRQGVSRFVYSVDESIALALSNFLRFDADANLANLLAYSRDPIPGACVALQ